MCGIAGILGKYRTELNDTFKKIAQIQCYRGPDYFGCLFDQDLAVFHNRLSIIDTSAHSNQPYEDSDNILLFNGEIYNYKELAQKRLGEEFHQVNSDTIILFHLLKKYGKTIIKDLNGMFAFVFINKKEQNCLMARDRMGIKPLYYVYENNAVIFASEIKIVVKFLSVHNNYDVKTEVNFRALESIFILGSGEFQQIPFQKITELKPGTLGKIDYCENNKIYIESFYSINSLLGTGKKVHKKGLPGLIVDLDKCIHDSIGLHLRADVPVGTLCSGGLDSSLITAIASSKIPSVKIYHADFEGPGSERSYAESLAKYLKLDIKYVTMDEGTYLRLLPKAVWHSDVPIYHPNDISLYSIAECAKRDGVKVLLCGEGADELFGGYSWHRFFKNLDKFSNIFSKVPVTGKIKLLLNFLFMAKNFTKEELLFISGVHLNFTDTNLSEFSIRNLLLRNPESLMNIGSLENGYEKLGDTNPRLSAFISNNLFGHLSSILHRNDRMCMMASVESRVPFLENNLIDFALTLDSEYKINRKESKYLLKKVAEKYLPKNIIYRTKMGFPVPYDKYLKSCNNAIFDNGFINNYLGISSNILKGLFRNNPMLHFHLLTTELWGQLFVLNVKHELLSEKISEKVK